MDDNGSFKKKKIYFSQVSNTALRDEKLSLKAKGLYSLIQSYVTLENFTLYKNTLKKQCKEKEKAFDSAWKELKDKGYLTQERHRKSDGTFGYVYDLLDVAIESEKPHPQNAGMDNAGGGKGGIYNNTDLNNTYSNKKEENTVSVTNYYSDILGRKLTKPEMTALLNFKLDYSAELTIRAIDEMVLGNKGNSIKYLRTVLKDWHSKGLTTVESVDIYLSEREVKKDKKRKQDEKKRTEAAEHKNKKESSFQYSGQREMPKDLEKQLLGWGNE